MIFIDFSEENAERRRLEREGKKIDDTEFYREREKKIFEGYFKRKAEYEKEKRKNGKQNK